MDQVQGVTDRPTEAIERVHDDHVTLARVRDDLSEPGPVRRRAGLPVDVDPIARDPDLFERVDLPIEVLLHRRHARVPELHAPDRTGCSAEREKRHRLFGTNLWDGHRQQSTGQRGAGVAPFHFQGSGTATSPRLSRALATAAGRPSLGRAKLSGMRERAILKLDSGDELPVELDRDDLDRDEILVRRTAPSNASRRHAVLAVIDEHLASAQPHAAGTTDRLLQADRSRRF